MGFFKVVLKMQSTWIGVFLLLSAISILSSSHPQGTKSIDDQLAELSITCGSCHGNRTTDDMRVDTCQCGAICAMAGTCCWDSKHRNHHHPLDDAERRRLTPFDIYRSTERVFMMTACRPGWDGDRTIKDLCESVHSIVPDPFLWIPVTNPRTWITYKNYYCFACNEDDDSDDSPVLWDFQFFHGDNLTLGPITELQRGGWDLFTVKGYQVYMVVGAPEKIASRVHWYRKNVRSACAEDWTDEDTREKCEGHHTYTSLVSTVSSHHSAVFRNPHCAICNRRPVSDLACASSDYQYAGGPPYGFLFVGLFSFEDKVSRCPRNQVYDAYAKKCRAVRCGRNSKLVGTACVDDSEPSAKPEVSATTF